MALVNSFIDVRAIASIGVGLTTVFAHGLPAIPDFVAIQSTDVVTAGLWSVTFDATNVTVAQRGAVVTPALLVTTIIARNIVR